MAIEVRCVCGQLVYAEERFAGQNVQCPHCKASVAVPVATATARPAPPTGGGISTSSGPLAAIVGVVGFFALMGWMKGCKDDLAKERANPPPIIDRNKNR